MYLERTWFLHGPHSMCVVCGVWYVFEGVLASAEGEVTKGTLATRLHHGSSHAGTLASQPCPCSVTYCLREQGLSPYRLCLTSICFYFSGLLPP